MKNELKILGKNGNLYSLEEYLKLPGNTYGYAVGIVFSSPVIGQRILAFPSWDIEWGELNTMYNKCYSELEAVQIISGLEDTKRVAEAQKDLDYMTAAQKCLSCEPKKFQWYLPSLVELGVIYALRDEINDAMKQLGCDNTCLLPTEKFCKSEIWSCFEINKFNSWYVSFQDGNFYYDNKNIKYTVRAIAMLPSTNYKVTANLEDLKQSSKGIEDLSDTEVINELRNRGYKGQINKTLDI